MSIQVLEDGEANFYTLAPDKGNWYCRIQFNGELLPERQKHLAQLFADSLNEKHVTPLLIPEPKS